MVKPPSQTYNEDGLSVYTPMLWSLKEIRAAIPPHLFLRDTSRGLRFLARDLVMAAIAWAVATYIDPYARSRSIRDLFTPLGAEIIRWCAWFMYWWFQGLIFTGIWVIGHECGHGAFSDHKMVNDVIGFITHSFLFTPYFSWKVSHHRHHSNHASMERDEVYVPKTRSDLGLREEGDLRGLNYDEILGDTPVYTLFLLIVQQLMAFPAYLLFNVSGQKTYPKWTNHFDRKLIFFSLKQIIFFFLFTKPTLFYLRKPKGTPLSSLTLVLHLWSGVLFMQVPSGALLRLSSIMAFLGLK